MLNSKGKNISRTYYVVFVAEYIVCRVFLFSLFLYFVPAPFFFGEGVNFSAKRPLSQKSWKKRKKSKAKKRRFAGNLVSFWKISPGNGRFQFRSNIS